MHKKWWLSVKNKVIRKIDLYSAHIPNKGIKRMDEISNPRSNGDYDNLCAHSVMILQTLGSIL